MDVHQLLDSIKNTAEQDVPELERFVRAQSPEMRNLALSVLLGARSSGTTAHLELIAMLMLHGADPYAATMGRPSAFESLDAIFQGDHLLHHFKAALINTRNQAGRRIPAIDVDAPLLQGTYTPLSYAASQQWLFCTRWLLHGRGASPNAAVFAVYSPIGFAMGDFQRWSNELFEHAGDDEAGPAIRDTFPKRAARRFRRDVAEAILRELIEQGADPEPFLSSLYDDGTAQYVLDFVRALQAA